MLEDGNIIVAEQIRQWRKSIRPSVSAALQMAPDDRMGWAPVAGMLTLGAIFLHLAETSDWWYDEVIEKHTSIELANRTDVPREQIAAHLDDHWQRLERFFGQPANILRREFSFEQEGQTHTFTGAWIFVHLFEHDVHHRSQINQYMRMLDLTPHRV